MADEYVTLVDHEIGRKVEAGRHPAEGGHALRRLRQIHIRPVLGRPVGLAAWRGNAWQFPPGGAPGLMMRA